jgi:hypothetical protein
MISAIGHAHLLGLPFGLTRDRHKPTHTLDQKIVSRPRGIGTGLTESGNRAIDKLRIAILQVVIGKFVSRKIARLEVLDKRVRVHRHPANKFRPFRLRYIETNRPLVAIGSHVIGTFSRLVARIVFNKRRRKFTRIIASARPLNLDHVGTKVTQHLRAGGARKNAGQIDNGNARQRADRLWHADISLLRSGLSHQGSWEKGVDGSSDAIPFPRSR